MKAIVMRELKAPLHVEEVDIDSPKPSEVLIRTGATGVCHSDLHYWEGKYSEVLPVVPGHEASGTVEEVGSQVTYVKPGDKVIVCFAAFCGECDNCLRGKSAICRRVKEFRRGPTETPRLSQNGKIIHQHSGLGCYAEKMLLNERSVLKVEQDVSLEQMALISCGVATGVGAVLNTTRVEPGSTVAVIGCGGVGLHTIQGARIGGAGRIIAIDPVEMKLAMAREMGATDVVDASSGDVAQKVIELTGGGVDFSYEVVGLKETAELAYNILDKGGIATIVGMIPEGVKFKVDGPSMLDEKKIQGSNMGSTRFRIDMPRYIDYYLQGRLKLDEMITKRIKLEDANQAFEDVLQGNVARSIIIFD